MNQAFVSWSGGKDCCLAFYKAITAGLNIRYLANMLTKDGTHSRTHGLSADILQLQSQAIGIPLLQRQATWDTYEDEFKKLLGSLKQEEISNGIFGDIDLDEHREWVERICVTAGITPHLPLWGRRQDEILSDFIFLGFEAVVVATRADLLGEEWLGRKIDLDFINQLTEFPKTNNITLCGEAGEYHTLVVDGPIFQKRLEIQETGKALRDEHWFLDIIEIDLKNRL
ncbi:diphthine--ammonia ligase [Chloroflexota bacterium]